MKLKMALSVPSYLNEIPPNLLRENIFLALNIFNIEKATAHINRTHKCQNQNDCQAEYDAFIHHRTLENGFQRL